jgi:rfaE bifunctional protein nucleotidyltransferase chain/domain
MNPTKLKIVTQKEAELLVARWKRDNQKVVFTNGCFDILHLGHIDYLEKARTIGDKLIVAVNTDDSVRRLKGPQRPLNSEYSRARLLAALDFVDAVVLFNEDTPYEIISTLVPNLLVKGSDYSIDDIVGADVVINNGGSVETIDLVEGFSTTGLIEKIKNEN